MVGEVTSLAHEAGDDTMEARSFVAVSFFTVVVILEEKLKVITSVRKVRKNPTSSNSVNAYITYPVHNARKFSAVLGTTSALSSNVILSNRQEKEEEKTCQYWSAGSAFRCYTPTKNNSYKRL